MGKGGAGLNRFDFRRKNRRWPQPAPDRPQNVRRLVFRNETRLAISQLDGERNELPRTAHRCARASGRSQKQIGDVVASQGIASETFDEREFDASPLVITAINQPGANDAGGDVEIEGRIVGFAQMTEAL